MKEGKGGSDQKWLIRVKGIEGKGLGGEGKRQAMLWQCPQSPHQGNGVVAALSLGLSFRSGLVARLASMRATVRLC